MLRFLINLAGPVFAKEMVEVSRRKRYYFNRVLYGVALFIAVSLVWSENHWQIERAGSGQLQAMAQIARYIFTAVGAVQYGAIFLLVPLFVAGLIAGERESNSLDLLFTTTLHDREIVLGKLASRLAIMTLLVLCGVPIINLILLFGGIDPAAVIRTEWATLLGMLYAGSTTIYFSVISKSPTTALVRSYWWMVVWMLGLPMMGGLCVEAFNIGPNDPAAIVIWGQILLNPGFLFIAGLAPEMHQQVGSYLGSWFYPLAFVPICLWCAFLLWRSVARLRMAPTVFMRLTTSWHPLAALMRFYRRQIDHLDYLRRQSAERFWFGLPVGNPLWLRSRWTPVYDRERHIGRVQWLGWLAAVMFLVFVSFADSRSDGEVLGLAVFWTIVACLVLRMVWIWVRRESARKTLLWGALFLLVGILMYRMFVRDRHAWSDEEVVMVFLVPTWIAAWLLTVILGATSLVGDRRRGFFELVLTSPLEPKEIVNGTMLAVGQHLQPVYGLAWSLTVFFALTGGVNVVGAFDILVTGTLFGLLLLELGVICSLAAERAPGAMIPTFAFGVVMCAGLALFCVMFDEYSVPALMLVCLVGLVVFMVWAHRRASPAAIGGLFLFVHLTLVLAMCALNVDYTHSFSSYPRTGEKIAVATNPLTLTYCHVDRGELRRLGYGPFYVPCYWGAALISLTLAWRWTMRHFDRLAGRACFARAPMAKPIVLVVPRRSGTPGIQPATAAPIVAELIADPTRTEIS